MKYRRFRVITSGEITVYRVRQQSGIKFETPTGKKSVPWQAHCWFTKGFNLKSDINYYFG